MARTLFDCVGDWFEEVIIKQFPELSKANDQDGRVPDFVGDVFDAEAKVGFWDYGAQLKEAQVRNFESNGRPLVYIIGYHDAEGLRDKTKGMSEREIEEMLATEAGLDSAYVLSNSIVKRLWQKESRAATNHPDWRYFSVRPRHLRAIIENIPFERAGTRYTPSRWYRIKRRDFLLQPAPLLSGRTRNLKFGTILNRQEDDAVIKYLQDRKLII